MLSNRSGKGNPTTEINKKPRSLVEINMGLEGQVMNLIKNSDFEKNNNIKKSIKQ